MKTAAILLLLTISLFSENAFSQNKPRFRDDVQTIKKYDQMYNPPAHPILFTGSSSIRKWDNAERTFAKHVVLNRGIGGAVINDIIFYLDDMVFAYHPRQIVIYVGENDLPDEASTADSILNRTIRLITDIRMKLPDVPIIYISLKPSPSREKYLSKAIASNKLIKDYLQTQQNATFVDIFTPMITADGKTRPELFLNDMLHMNAAGYAIWQKAIEPLLLP